MLRLGDVHFEDHLKRGERSLHESCTIGVGMVPRGKVGLIFAGIGASLMLGGHPVVGTDTYAAAVFMVVVTTMATPPLRLWSLRRDAATAAKAKSP